MLIPFTKAWQEQKLAGRLMSVWQEGGGRIQEILDEFVRRDVEDRSWRNLGALSDPVQQDVDLWRSARNQGYQAWRDNPLAAQIVRLTTTYGFGEGVGIPQAEDEEVQEVIEDFWGDDDNQLALFSYPAQQEASNKLQWAGELFLAMFLGDDGSVRLGEVDSLEINQIVTDPQNSRKPMYYQREWQPQTFDFGEGKYELADKRKKAYYADWRNEEPGEKVEAHMYWVPINKMAGRGLSPLYRVAPWLKITKQTAESLATICRAQAMFATVLQVPGTKDQIQRLKSGLMSDMFGSGSGTASSLGSGELQDPGAAGRMFVGSEGTQLQPFRVDFGASQVAEAIRQMKLMVAAGSGIFEHYFGDPSTGNLATATAMEGPMIKMFRAWQKLWEGVYIDLTSFAIRHAKSAGRLAQDIDDTFDIDFPPLLDKDMVTTIERAKLLRGHESGEKLATKETVMAELGIEDVAGEIERIEAEEEEQGEKAEAPPPPIDTGEDEEAGGKGPDWVGIGKSLESAREYLEAVSAG